MKKIASSLLLALAMIILLAPHAQASSWPTRPIRLVVPFAAGGSADALGRIFAQALSDELGKQVFVENRGGAGGVTASAQVARGEPDGYTLLVSGVASHAIAPALNGNTGYDPVHDFTHIAYMGGPPIVWVVNPSLGARTPSEVFAILRNSPTPVDYGSPGTGTQGHLVAAYLARKLDLPMQPVHYKGAGPAMLDIVAGRIKMGFMTWTTALGQIQAGTVIPIAITADQRLPNFPDLPTFKELGYPDLIATTWFSISGPPGISADIVDRLNKACVKALDNPEVGRILAQEGILAAPMSAEAFGKFVAAEVARWAPIVTLSGAKAE